MLAVPVMPAAAAQAYNQRTKGLPPLTIKDVKVITTSGGRRSRWVFLKIITNEAGLWGIGSANNQYQTYAVITALEKAPQAVADWKGPQSHRRPVAELQPAHLLAGRTHQQQCGQRDG